MCMYNSIDNMIDYILIADVLRYIAGIKKDWENALGSKELGNTAQLPAP